MTVIVSAGRPRALGGPGYPFPAGIQVTGGATGSVVFDEPEVSVVVPVPLSLPEVSGEGVGEGVGSKVGVDFDELPGGPLIIDAIDLAKGGIDKATHGYLQTFVKRPEAFAHVGVATEAWTASTAYGVGTIVKNGGSNVLQAIAVGAVPGAASGASGGTAPTNPAVGATVNDGAVTWKRLA